MKLYYIDFPPCAMRVRVCVWALQMDASCDDEWQTAHASNYTRSTYGNGHIIIMHDMVQSPIWWLYASHLLAPQKINSCRVSCAYGNSSNWPLMNCLTFYSRRPILLGVRHSESICPSKRKKKANWSSIFAITVHVFQSTVAKFNWRETYKFTSPFLTASSV